MFEITEGVSTRVGLSSGTTLDKAEEQDGKSERKKKWSLEIRGRLPGLEPI